LTAKIPEENNRQLSRESPLIIKLYSGHLFSRKRYYLLLTLE